jgi:heparan-alpha-glucosaminide N-acetyltransferase
MADDKPQAAATATALPRLASIDAYRGFVMLAMISHGFGLAAVVRELANRNDSNVEIWRKIAYQFDHVPWVGCVFWDLIQPSFMFLVGTAMAFSCAVRQLKGDSYGRMAIHSAWRAVALTLLGIFLRTSIEPSANFPGVTPVTNFTFEDVLTQMGLGYFFLFLLWGRSQKTLFGVALAILVGYWALFFFYPRPPSDFDTAAVGVPANWEYNLPGIQAHWNKNTNPASDFDRWFLNLFPRLEPFEFNRGGYQTLSFVPSLATMIFGLMAGELLRGGRSGRAKFWILIAAGFLGLASGYALHAAGISPLVKRIWTPSWTLYSTGWTCLMLAGFYGVIELAGLRRWAFPLVVVGMNSIAIYVLDKLTRAWLVKRLMVHLGSGIFTLYGLVDPAYAPLVQSVMVMAIFWLVMYWMYRRKLFLKI